MVNTKILTYLDGTGAGSRIVVSVEYPRAGALALLSDSFDSGADAVGTVVDALVFELISLCSPVKCLRTGNVRRLAEKIGNDAIRILSSWITGGATVL